FVFSSENVFSRDCFERFAGALPFNVIRAKGFIWFPDGAQLFNFVAGRWELEPFEADRTELVFIGKNVLSAKTAITSLLAKCQEAESGAAWSKARVRSRTCLIITLKTSGQPISRLKPRDAICRSCSWLRLTRR